MCIRDSHTAVTSNRSQRLLETTCEFSNWVTIEGLKIATTRRFFVSSPVEDPLHVWTLADLRVNQLSPEEYFERRGGSEVPPTPSPLDSAAAAVEAAGRAVGAAAESLGHEASPTARPTATGSWSSGNSSSPPTVARRSSGPTAARAAGRPCSVVPTATRTPC